MTVHGLFALIAPGASVMMVAAQETRPVPPVGRAATLLRDLGEVSRVRFSPAELKVLKQIQGGHTIAAQIARRLGVSAERVQQIASRIVWRLERERARRERDTRGVPLEERPIEELQLDWPVEWRLDLFGIRTIGQLVEKSESELLRIRALGVGRVKHLKERLWLEARRVLRGPAPPTRSKDGRFGTNTSLLLPIGVSEVDVYDLIGRPEWVLGVALPLAVAVATTHWIWARRNVGAFVLRAA